MSQVELKLTQDATQGDDSIPFERRHTPRRRLVGNATAIRTETIEGSPRYRLHSVELCDASQNGVGLLSGDPIPRGTALLIVLPAHGPDQGPEILGHVARCVPQPDGRYRIGVASRRGIVAA